MSTILVVGSHGTIGAPLVKKLRNLGHIVYTSDYHHKFDGLYDNKELYMRCDIYEYRQLERVLYRTTYDYIYFLAAEFGRVNGEEYYEHVWRSNIIGTKNFLTILSNLSKLLSKPKVIFASSSEVYGDIITENGYLSEEDTDKRAIHLSNDYAISKHVNEMQIKNAIFRNSNLKISTMRFFNCYGPGEFYNSYRSVVCLFCYRILHHMPVTIYENYHRVFMFVDDFINTLAQVCDSNWNDLNHNIINIGGEEYCSVEDMYNEIKLHVPESRTVVNYLSEDKHNTTNKRPDINKSQKMLNHNPHIRLNAGIPITLTWMREVYNVKGV